MRNTNDPEEIWIHQKNELLKKFSNLRESDFHYDYGMRDSMMDKLQAKLEKSREELNALLQSL